MQIQAWLRETETRRVLNVAHVPMMKTASSQYRFAPKVVEITYRTHEAPEEVLTTDAKVSGPVLLNDGSLSATWVSRTFAGDLGIDGGPKWLRILVNAFDVPRGVRTITRELPGDPETWG